jgi:hypothetical protein
MKKATALLGKSSPPERRLIPGDGLSVSFLFPHAASLLLSFNERHPCPSFLRLLLLVTCREARRREEALGQVVMLGGIAKRERKGTKGVTR